MRGAFVGARGAPVRPLRSVLVARGDRRLGRVVVSTPLDEDLLDRLRQAAQLPVGDRLVFLPAQSLSHGRPETIEHQGREYRALAVPLVSGPGGMGLAALRPAAAVRAAADDVLRVVLLAGLAAFGAVAGLAYLLAPAIARGRVARTQRAQAARILSHVRDGVFLVDEAGIVRFWNPAAETSTGLAASDVVGRRAVAAIPGWSAARPRVRVSRADESWPAAIVGLDLAGGELLISVEGVASPAGTVYAFRDVTEAERLEELRREFVATVSHELRTPLAAIYGASMTLSQRERELTKEQAAELLGLVTSQSHHLAHRVEQILQASQLDAGRLRLREDAVDAADVARDVVDAARASAPQNISLRLDVAGRLPRARADADRLHQVLSNLVDNAIKYSPAGGEVRISLRRRNGAVRIAVRDEGLGIPSADRDRVFDKFSRLDPDLARGVGGTGLGLYICRALVEQMDGRVWVESQPGRGSAFFVELPAARRAA